MRTNPFTALSLCLFLLLAAAPLIAEDAPPAPRELRERMTTVYQSLQTDMEYLELTKQLAGNLRNREVVDRYLRYLPMSPMLMLEIDMHVNHWEIVVPRIIAEWHQRWIELHEKEAVAMYGKAYVQNRLKPVVDEGSGTPGFMLKTTVGTNRNVAATSTPAPEDYQGEIQVVVNPSDPDEVVAAANTWDDMGGSCGDYGLQAAFYSGDGGTTWNYSCPPDAAAYGMTCGGVTFGSDPALFWNDADEVFLEYMLICYLGGSNYRYSIVVAKSTTGGASWTAQGVVINSYTSGALEDKNFYAIDNNPASPYYGRHYTCWDRNNNEKSAHSTDSGATWTEVDLPTTTGSGSGSRLDLGCELAVEDDGTVHVIFDTLSCFSTCNNEEMFYSRSTNGGVTWSTPLEIRDFNLVGFSNANCPDAQDDRCIGPMGAIDVDNSGGACDGNLYATFGDYTTGGVNNTDIYVRRSTNGGNTWDTPVQVNDDGLVRAQFHPFLVVDQSHGYVIVTWHDARNDAGNDAVDYYLARSVDCGLTWETNLQVSQPSTEFNNSTISYSNENSSDNPDYNPNQYGEYMGLDVLDGTAYVAWADTRHYFPSFTTESQDENVGFVVVDILPDVWSKDKPWDTGLEPDPATAGNNMWESEDIWVRNDATPGPHQNPEAGQQNYVWVNVRNRSDMPAYNIPIEVWGTLAATGLSWQTDWTLLGIDTVPVVPANGLVQATVPWTPTQTGHYCLLVRHNTAQDPLTNPEISNPNYNARYNNNIVWRNVNIVDLITTPIVKVKFIARNIGGVDLTHNLVFEDMAAKADGTFLSRGKVTLLLPEEFADRWNEDGSKGDGFERVDDRTVVLTDAKRAAMTVDLKKREEFTFVLVFEDTVERTDILENERPANYTYRVIQEEVGDDGKVEVVGGITYQVIAPQR